MLATEMLKIHMNDAPPIFSSRFESHNTKYNLGNVTNFSIPYVRTVFFLDRKSFVFGSKNKGLGTN